MLFSIEGLEIISNEKPSLRGAYLEVVFSKFSVAAFWKRGVDSILKASK
jgi:hypothetical protein